MYQLAPHVVYPRCRESHLLFPNFCSGLATVSFILALSFPGLCCVSAVGLTCTGLDDPVGRRVALQQGQPQGCWIDCPLAACCGIFVYMLLSLVMGNSDKMVSKVDLTSVTSPNFAFTQ